MVVTNEILVKLNNCNIIYEVWEKLRETIENTMSVNQGHLIRNLVSMQLDESKSANGPRPHVHFHLHIKNLI